MPRLLVVHHTPSPAMQAMLAEVIAGAGHEEIEDVEVIVRPALTAGAADVLGADGYLLGTPANTGGAVRAVESIAGGLGWRRARPPACVTGIPTSADLSACRELGAIVAVQLAAAGTGAG